MERKKYAVSNEGVIVLKTMSAAIMESSESINKLIDILEIVSEEYADTLGPHQSSIDSVVEEIRSAQNAAIEPVQSISSALNDVANSYQEILNDDRIVGISGN